MRRCKAGSEKWWEAVVEANVANSDHMAEEERQDLTDFRQQTTLALRHGIAVQFLRFEAEHWATGVKPVDKDPEEFVEDNEPLRERPMTFRYAGCLTCHDDDTMPLVRHAG